MFKTIDHFAVHCSDALESARFYETCFGFTRLSTHERPQGRIIYMGLGNTVLELTQKPREPMSGMHFAIATDDMDSALDHLAANNVPVIQEARPLTAVRGNETDVRRAVFAGPDGEMIELRG